MDIMVRTIPQGLTKFTLGTVQLGMSYGIANKIGKPSDEQAFNILDAACMGGVNSFDTASTYGNSEELLGEYFSLRHSIIENPYIVTKFKIDPSLGTNRELLEKQIRHSAERSLERMRKRIIPVFMLHTASDMTQYGTVVRESLVQLKNNGLIEKAGVSVYNAFEVEELLNDDLYEAVQLPMSVFDQRLVRNGFIQKMKSSGKIVFIRSVFMQGLLFMKPEELPENMQFAAGWISSLRTLAEKAGMSVQQVALSFIRDLDGVDSLVLGAETVTQIRENMKLMEGPGLNGRILDAIEKLSNEVQIERLMLELTGRKI
jgi:aryl-alcohol dehydrogenase-like predicted oxidoreductase